MAYIASKPVHFDRDYKIGEVIPPEIIEPKMVRKLIEMGKIIQVSLPSDEKKEPDVPSAPESPDSSDGEESPESASAGAEAPEDKGASANDETPQTPQESGRADDDPDAPHGEVTAAGLIAGTVGEFTCEVCGRAFSSRQGLATHIRSHKE